MDELIKGRKPGDNITLLNTISRRGTNPENNKYAEFLTLVYKDCDTGQKYMQEIINPIYEYYVAHDDSRTSYNRLFIEKDKVDKVTVPHMNIEKDIAERVGLKDFYYDNIRNGNKMENRKLHLHPDVFNSDMNIEDHYRYLFGKTYKNNQFPVTKSFFDIEVDTINMVGDFPEPGECPINAISLILQEQKQIYVFLLRTKTNPQIKEFEDEVNSGKIFPELNAFITDAVGGPDIIEKYNIGFGFNFLFYDEDDEINLIKDLFNAINNFKPDFALAWNMGFDIPYIIARIQKLGYRPEDIMCHPDFKYKSASYYVDERMKSETAERGDFALISSYTVFLDQMIHFASRRKGQNKFISFSLDFIGDAVAKVKKLDYKDITTNISELPYKSYKTFVFYNIMDTIVQYCIEHVTGDMDYVFNKCNINNTRYSKAHRQTVYLTNRGIKEFYNDGFIMGNNTNRYNPPPQEKYSGAFVADGKKINHYSSLSIFGRMSEIFNNCNDFDFASLYPSILRQYNIAAHTQIGRIIMNETIYKNENKCKLKTWTRSGEFIENLQSQVWLEICTRWFGLSDYTKLYHEVEEFFSTLVLPMYGLRYRNREGLIIPMVFTDSKPLQFAMDFDHDRREVKDQYTKPDLNAWKEWRDNAIANPNQHF